MIGAIPSVSQIDKFAELNKPGKLKDLRVEVARLEEISTKVRDERVRAETANDAASRRVRTAEAKEASVELREAAVHKVEALQQTNARRLRDDQEAHHKAKTVFENENVVTTRDQNERHRAQDERMQSLDEREDNLRRNTDWLKTVAEHMKGSVPQKWPEI